MSKGVKAAAKKGAAKVQKKVKSVHRARKPRPVRPLDERKPNNHEDRHEAKKAAARLAKAETAALAEAETTQVAEQA